MPPRGKACPYPTLVLCQRASHAHTYVNPSTPPRILSLQGTPARTLAPLGSPHSPLSPHQVAALLLPSASEEELALAAARGDPLAVCHSVSPSPSAIVGFPACPSPCEPPWHACFVACMQQRCRRPGRHQARPRRRHRLGTLPFELLLLRPSLDPQQLPRALSIVSLRP